jgi:hypothetical protein
MFPRTSLFHAETLVSAVALCGIASFCFAVKVTPPPKHKPERRGMAARRVHILKPGQKPDSAKPSPFTGIELLMPAGLETIPIYRIARPDDSVPAGLDGNWSSFEPVETNPGTDLGNTDATQDFKNDTAPNASASTEKTQRISLPPGPYVIQFSLPVATENLMDFAVPILWSQSVGVRKGRSSRVKVDIPAVPADSLAHVAFKPEGTLYPFNAFSIDLLSSPMKGNGLRAHWDYFTPVSGWPTEIPVTLVPGRYHVVLAASSFGAFSSLRYELPDPITITSSGEVPIKTPLFFQLNAEITDRKGKPVMGIPLIFQGAGQTMVMVDTRNGTVNVRLPVGNYKVKAMVWDDRAGQKDVVLDRSLNMASDQARKWKAPTTMIDFGFSAPPKPLPATPKN